VGGANCPRLWITDFGLAQVQSENTRLTMSGDLLGTLRYMSPEQALGNRVIVDHRTDIYSLGVTLYELLTLQPVFNGKDRQEVLRQIAFEEPKPPRRLDKHIPAELETIILKAMERRPEERYAMAGELAADLRRWLMHEPIRARSPSLLERGRKWARRHRAWVNAAAVVLVIAFAASVASATLIWQEKEQKAAALQAKETALQQAEARTQFARDAADGFYTEVAETWLKGQPQLTEVQRTFLLKALRFYEELANEKSADPTIRWETARANRRAAEIHSNLGENARAEEHYGRAIRLLDELKAEFPSEPRYRLSLAETCRKFGLFLKDPNQLLTEESNGLLKRNPARPQEAEAALRRALGLFQALELEAPGGRVYRRGQMACLSNLGNLLRDTNRLHEAVQAYRQARDVCLKLAADYPDIPPHADPDKNVELLMAAGRYKEAEDRIREAGFDEEELKVGFPELEKVQHNWAITLHALGLAIAAQNRPKEAVEYFRRSRAFYEKLVAEFPAMPKYQFDLAGCCSNLGAMLARSGQPKEAEEAWRHAVVVLEPLDAKDPKARQMLADCYLYLAYQLKSPDRTGDFQQVLRRAVALFEKLGSISPQSLTIRERLAEACNMLAWSLCTCADPQLRHPQQAVELAKRAIELATQGQVGDYWNTLGTAHYRAGVWQCAVAALEESRKARSGGDSDDFFFLAMAHWQLGDKDKAREWYDKAVQWMEKNKPNDEELRGFREEAAKLLGVKDQKQ